MTPPTPEPLPCPWGEGHPVETHSTLANLWRVCCEQDACFAEGPLARTPEGAVKAWNTRRTPSAEVVAAIEALKNLADIIRGLRKCRHGRTCCVENDNTIGAILDARKVLDAIAAAKEVKP